jgi:hypothetical protein
MAIPDPPPPKVWSQDDRPEYSGTPVPFGEASNASAAGASGAGFVDGGTGSDSILPVHPPQEDLPQRETYGIPVVDDHGHVVNLLPGSGFRRAGDI